MHPKVRRTLSPTLLAIGLLLLAPRAFAEEGCTTASCHPKVLQGKHVHPPTETCTDCHASVSTPHPQKGQKTFKLSEPVPALCLTCHDTIGKKPHVHDPVKEGACLSCHAAHASDHAKLLAEPIKDLCTGCHDDVVKGAVVHGPAGDGECTSCHAPHDADHPKLLPKTGDALCFECHDDIATAMKKKVVHGAIENGCTSCHSPHASAHRKLLADEGAKLCFGCHDDVEKRVAAAPVAHAPVTSEKACASCHTPHAGDHAHLLLQPGKETCTGCHKSVVTAAMTNLHGPVADGDCGACHEPHGSANGKLLAKEFPPGPYVPYTGTEFALCFSCHERDIVQYPDTAAATEFRDGARNLHYVHVNDKQKARSCKLCHDVHGSGNPKLLADSVPFATWRLPIRFVKTETGGGCSPGCHKPAYYDRKTPGKRPPVTPKVERPR